LRSRRNRSRRALRWQPFSPRRTGSTSSGIGAGVWVYTLSTRPRDAFGVFAFWGLVLFLGVIYLMNAFGPPPPNVTAIGIAGVAGAALFIVWSWWIDRHRTSA
jgi:hypothetical protein